MRTICKAVEKSSQNGRKLGFLVHTDSLIHDLAQWELVKRPPLWPIKSLEDILNADASHYMPGDKVILAANLARALLRVHSCDLTLREMRAKDIFFLYNPSDGMVSDGYNPYLACSLIPPTNHSDDGIWQDDKLGSALGDKKQDDTRAGLKFPVLVSFAELLMEIALGRKMGPYDCRVDIALLGEIDPKHYTGEVVKMVGKPYVDVIIRCLMTNQSHIYDSDSDSDSDSESNPDSDQDNDRCISSSSKFKQQDQEEQAKRSSREAEERICRNVIRTVVASLEKAQKIFAPETNQCFRFRVRKADRAVPLKAQEPVDKAGGQMVGGKSFDDMKLDVSPTDQRYAHLPFTF